MSAASFLLTEEQLLCCICLDVFTDPVTLPCGHNFCRNCISEHLNFNSQRRCPMCKEHVDKKYKLGVNTFISEMALQFRQSAGKKARNKVDQQGAETEKVPFEVLTETKQTSPKLCFLLALVLAGLICFTTFLNLHQTASSLKADQHVHTVENRMCTKHDKPLALYCKNEQRAICRSCAESTHRFHQVVPLKEEYEAKKSELKKTEAEIQQKILERKQKTEEIKRSIEVSKDAADREAADGVRIFNTLIESLETAKAEFIWTIEDKQEKNKKQAKVFIRGLEQETSDLEEKWVEVKRLSRSKDRVHFLQNFARLNASALADDWTDVSVCPARYEEILRTAMVSAASQFTDTLSAEMKMLNKAEVETVRLSRVEVILDPDTAHPALHLSDDGKQVYYGAEQKLPDGAKRFERGLFVLGKQSFSCGKFHYDVEVKGKTAWILGVARKSVNRKGEVELSPEGGVWALSLRNRNQYFALSNPPAALSVNTNPERVSVFVDYDEGLVSFYDVDAAVLLFSFTGCSFSEKLCPLFSPSTNHGGSNSAPLIISPVA